MISLAALLYAWWYLTQPLFRGINVGGFELGGEIPVAGATYVPVRPVTILEPTATPMPNLNTEPFTELPVVITEPLIVATQTPEIIYVTPFFFCQLKTRYVLSNTSFGYLGITRLLRMIVGAINALRGIIDGDPPLDKLPVFEAIERADKWKSRL